MLSLLDSLRFHVNILAQGADAPVGRKARGGKTERLKAIGAIDTAISRKSTQNALSAASRLEMVRGPQEDKADMDPPLGWAELIVVVLDTLNVACHEGLSSKSASNKGVASMKPDYMSCFKNILKISLAQGPPGVIRSVVPACLFYAHEWLSEPALRTLLADEIWQCVRDLLNDDSNRAMLTPPFIRTWVDVCVEQLTGRGPLHYRSNVATNFAADVLQTLARGVDNYDVLTQSTKSIAPSKMLGGDFGYAIICERCCLMLVISESMPRKEGRELQAVAFKTLTTALSDHALDVVRSSGLKSVIHASLKPIAMSWNDRSVRDSAISMAKTLLVLAPSHSELLETCRGKVLGDMRDEGSSAVVRAGNEVSDDFIDTTASCMSLRECLEFARGPETINGHIIIWLRTAFAIMSRRVYKKGFSLITDAADVFEQCTKAAETVAAIFHGKLKVRDGEYADIVRWATKVVAHAATYADRIYGSPHLRPCFSLQAWQTLYRVLMEQLSKVRYSTKSRAVPSAHDGKRIEPDQVLIATLSLLSSLQIISEEALTFSPTTSRLREDTPYPYSRFLSADEMASGHDVEFLRNTIARSGLRGIEAGYLRPRLLTSLVRFCKSSIPTKSATEALLNASCAAVGLSRGGCSTTGALASVAFKSERTHPPTGTVSQRVLDHSLQYLGQIADEEKITISGDRLVTRMKHQDLVWPLTDISNSEVLNSMQHKAVPSALERLLAPKDFSQSTAQQLSPDSLEAESLEDHLRSKLRSLAHHTSVLPMSEADLTDDAQSHAVQGFQDTGTEGSKCGFSAASACVAGSKIMIFVAGYLIEGIRRGLIPVSSNHSPSEPLQGLISMFTKLVQLFSQTDVEKLLYDDELPCGVVGTVSELALLLEQNLAGVEQAKPEREHFWGSLSQQLQNSLFTLASSLSKYLLQALKTRVNDSRHVVQQFSSGYLVDLASKQGFTNRGKRRALGERARRGVKRQRTFSSSSHEEGPTSSVRNVKYRSRDDIPPEDEDDTDSGSEPSDIDGFGENLFSKPSSEPSEETGRKGPVQGHATLSQLKIVASMALICVQKLSFIQEVIGETYERGLDHIDDIESVLSPDGFERAALVSNLVDPECIELRQIVWTLLLTVGTSETVSRAAQDIGKVGVYLKELERVAHAYVSFYIESLPISGQSRSQNRKSYPMPQCLENMRITFLQYGKEVLEFIRCKETNDVIGMDDTWGQGENVRISYSVNSLIEVSEHFRVSHALRMPRRARIAYLEFGVAAVQFFAERLANKEQSHESQGDQPASLQKEVHSIQAALCKFLADCDASVRTVAASRVSRFIATHFAPMAKVETTVQDSIPQRSSCIDGALVNGHASGPNIASEVDESMLEMQFSLSEPEQRKFSVIHESFRKVGSKSKACTALLTFIEIAKSREDLLPFCLVQILSRVTSGAGNRAVAYRLLARLCIASGHSSPRRLYKSYERIVLLKWFKIKDICAFPAELVVDEGHEEESIRYDWIRDEQDTLLPYVIVQDTSALEGVKKFADMLDLDVSTLLSNNASSLAIIFPMQFLGGGLHEKGLALWSAFDQAVNGRAKQLLSENKANVIRCLLRSTACGLNSLDEWNSRSFDIKKIPGFSRDAREVQPPLYDPLVVALAINALVEQTTKIDILPKSALHGTLFAEVRDFRSGDTIGESFKAFLEDCNKSRTSILRLLLSVSRFIDGPLTHSRQNHLDAYFSVGLLWRMLGVNILVKSSSERMLFYRLVVRGLSKIETVHDAAWLLQDVQISVAKLHKTCPEVSVSSSDLCIDSSKRDFLLHMNTSRELQMYELLSIASPALVSILAGATGLGGNEGLVSVASEALNSILQLCHDEGLWTVVLSNGPFPATKPFAQAKKLYNYARKAVEGVETDVSDDIHEAILASLTRFQGIQRFENGSYSPVLVLACLQEVKELLTERGVKSLRLQMKQEAWVRSVGSSSPTATKLERSIALFISVVYETLGRLHSGRACTPLGLTRISELNHDSKALTKMTHEIANVLGVLGLIRPQSHVFLSNGNRHVSIPPFGQNERYQDVLSGIETGFLMLLEIIHGLCPIAADYALSAMTELLRSDDGKKAYTRAKHELQVIAPFRAAARKLTVSNLPSNDFIPCDPATGDEIDTSAFPALFDTELWNLQRIGHGNVKNSEDWMRRLSYVLARHSSSTSLKKLSPVCYVSVTFACNMLPYILMDIVQNIASDGLQELSGLIKRYIIDDAEAPVDILRAIVHSLDVLSQIGLDQLVQKGISSRVHPESRVATLSSVYILDLSYLEVASAALRCGSYFSAIRFAQMHVDKQVVETELRLSKNGSRSRADRRYSSWPSRDSSVESAERIARKQVKDILKEAMTHINELDGVRAFGYEDGLSASSAGLAELDTNWSKSLSSWDIVLRNTARDDPMNDQQLSISSQGQEGAWHKSTTLQHELSVMTSFLGFGTLTIAADYWYGLLARMQRIGTSIQDTVRMDPSSSQKLNDLRYAVAWKLGQWESPPLLPPSNSSTRNESFDQPGFHEAIHRILSAFNTKRYDEVPKVLDKARLTQLKELVGDTSGVSTKQVFQTSARLHIFKILEDALSTVSPEVAMQALGSCPTSSANRERAIPNRSYQRITETQMHEGSIANEVSVSRSESAGMSTSALLRCVLGEYYGLNQEEADDAGGSLFRSVINAGIFAEDLPIALMTCVSAQEEIAYAAATVSHQILTENKSRNWARSTAALGTKRSARVNEANSLDQIAWKLQETRLRWSGCDDAPLKKQALRTANDIILRDLKGTMEQGSHSKSKNGGFSLGLKWESSSPSEQLSFLRLEACSIAAGWSLDMRTDEPMNIFEMYLGSGLKAVESCPKAGHLVGRAHLVMATFAEGQIVRIDAYRKSSKYDQMVRVIRQVEEKVKKLKAMKKTKKEKPKKASQRNRMRSNRSQVSAGVVTESQIGKDVDHVIRNDERTIREDKARLSKLNDNYKKWQLLACKHFAASLRHGSAQDLRAAFRMIALWLDSGVMRDAITMALVHKKQNDSPSNYLHSNRGIDVPSSKLLPLAPQLSSRLSSSTDVMPALFQQILANTIYAMAEKFPSHCLWQLLALSNSTRTSANQDKYHSLYRGDPGKKEAADEILRRLQSRHGKTVEEMKKVAHGYIRLSETSDDSKVLGKAFDMTKTALFRLGKFNHVHIPTVALPLSGTDYIGSLPTIAGFDKRASVCAGLSKPLKVICYSSEGQKYPQIVKGRDDLRGDAVMEQIFTILNSLLERDTEASRRNLLVRTYRIIPLSPFSGILQFVSNTRQFRELLVDPSHARRSLHERYRPKDMKNHEISRNAFDLKGDPSKRLQYLRDAWPRFQPVFRYFFLEQWPDPAEWFSHQLAYSRSVAVMSIVGFILGLGDRHLSNILVDVFTGEVVHIDFGIAFEQGKRLPTPELMPFRLTRDVVDGFGIAGIEGVFRRCCEVTLRVMRSNKDVLLTVAEVLLHDPMFNWDLVPEKVLREQVEMNGDRSNFESDSILRSTDESAVEAVAQEVDNDIHGSKDAQRALHRIYEKLDGLEDTERLSVEAHVARLVDEAQALHVIGTVYPGWAPWL